MAPGQPVYGVGDRISVVRRSSSRHVRTPRYLQGHDGRVTAVHGAFPDPESLAYGGDGMPRRWLYEVAFDATALWGLRAVVADTVRADVFEHWLQPTDQGATDR